MVVWKIYCAELVTILLKTAGHCCTLHQRRKGKTTSSASDRLLQGVLWSFTSSQAWSWLVSVCFMYQHLKEVNLRESSRAKIGNWWAGAHKVRYLTVTLTSVTSVTTSLRIISDLWCAAVLRENRLQIFITTSQNTHLTVFERCRVSTDMSDTSYIINF